MKIGLVGPVTPYRGGIAHFTTLLAKKLIEAGHDVQVVSFKKQYPAWLYPGESDKDDSPGRERVDAEYLLTPLNPISWYRSVKALLDFQPQQVIIPWWVTIWGPAFRFLTIRLKRRGIPVAILIHNTLPHEARPLDRWLACRALEKADRYIVMTEKEKGRLLSLLPGIKSIWVAPLPIFHIFKPTMLTQSEIRQSLGLLTEQLVLLHLGLIRPYKGLGVLIDALKIIMDKGEKVQLLIVGEFWDEKTNYLKQIEALGLEQQVKIFDSYVPDDDIATFFKAADLFVAPYVDGTQSAAVKTALGFGLPVVVTDVITDALIEMLPERCKVVPAGDAMSLADGIVAQINVSAQDPDQIQRVIDQSWAQMMLTITGYLVQI